MNTSADMSRLLSKMLRRNITNADRMDILLEEYSKSDEDNRFHLFAAVTKELIIERDIAMARKKFEKE